MKLNKIWKIAAPDASLAEQLSKSLHISQLLAQLLLNRGFTDQQTAAAFLQTDQQQFYDPFMMKDLPVAVERLAAAIENKEKITIYGDYDVDGITATAVMLKVLTALAAKVDFYIPERQSEGYGLHEDALKKIVQDGTKLLITVDCGISAAQEVALYKDKLDIIITDHHLVPSELPAALAIINPKQPDCLYPDKNLAGVGVAYKLCQGIWRKLRKTELINYLDIVALGTIADIVALTGENRLIVKRGLAELAITKNIGMKALIDICGLADKPINAGHVGFMLAPRLNAAGRLEHAAAAVELLITLDQQYAADLAEHLNRENLERQTIEKAILQAAEEKLAAVDKQAARVLVVAGDDWNSGVIGIVASRLVEAYYRPTIVISIKDGIGKGSCRSIAGFHMYEALKQCEQFLVAFGGHAQAAGLTILPENIPLLNQRLDEYAAAVLSKADYTPVLQLDAAVDLAAVSFELIADLEKLEPYGMGNPRPLFVCQQTKLTQARAIGSDGAHLRFTASQNNTNIAGIAWNLGGSAAELLAAAQVDIAFQPEINEWHGSKNIQLKAQSLKVHERALTEIDQLFLAAAQLDKWQNIAAAAQFFTKAVGVTFAERQANIAELKSAEMLQLVREPDNIHDSNAIMLKTVNGLEIGYLRKEIAAQLAPQIDSGKIVYRAQVMDITGDAARNYGVNIFIWQDNHQTDSGIRPSKISLAAVRKILLPKYEYHDKQQLALQALGNGENTLVIMGTGRGKSAIFQSQAVLEAINHNKLTIIVYPLRALVNDQYLSLTELLKPLGLNVYKGNGTISAGERGDLFAALQAGTADIVLTTPEFIIANRHFLAEQVRQIGLVVIDEAHHLAGGRRPAYQQLGKLLISWGKPTVAACTATAPDSAAAAIKAALQIQTTIIDKTVRSNLQICDKRNTFNKMAYLSDLIKQREKLLVFVNSRKQAVEIAAQLRQAEPALAEKIGFYHGGLANAWRVKVENWFKDSTLQVVIATSAFGEGIDLPDIRHVVQYHLPFNMTAFNQQCGRAGRDGQSGLIHLLFGQADIKINNLILADKAPERAVIGHVYTILKEHSLKQQPIILANAELIELYRQKYRNYIGEGAISASLKIMEELQLLSREKVAGERHIYWHDVPKGTQLSLMQSPAYQEGLNERDAFAKFSATVLNLSAKELLSCLNKPIYPTDE